MMIENDSGQLYVHISLILLHIQAPRHITKGSLDIF